MQRKQPKYNIFQKFLRSIPLIRKLLLRSYKKDKIMRRKLKMEDLRKRLACVNNWRGIDG